MVNILPLTGSTAGLLDARRPGLLPDGALSGHCIFDRVWDPVARLTAVTV